MREQGKFRTEFARALFSEAEIILADDPAGNSDKVSRNGVMELFCRLNEDYNVTFVMVTHDGELAGRCDRILYMEDGRIIRDRKL